MTKRTATPTPTPAAGPTKTLNVRLPAALVDRLRLASVVRKMTYRELLEEWIRKMPVDGGAGLRKQREDRAEWT